MPGSSTTPEGLTLALMRFPYCLPRYQARRPPDRRTFRGSMAGLCAPLPTLRRHPRGGRRTARGRWWVPKDIAATPYGVDVMASASRLGELLTQLANKDVNDLKLGLVHSAIEMVEEHLLGQSRALAQ